MSGRRRALGLTLAAALVVVALVYALRPFAKPVFPGVSGECRAAVLSAPGGDEEDQLALWAVTVGTDRTGFTGVFGDKAKFVRLGTADLTTDGALPDGFCATRARERLLNAGVFVIGAIGVLVLILRRHRVPAWRAR